MFEVQLFTVSIILLGLLISNVLALVLIIFNTFRERNLKFQGSDYYIISLAIADLILGILIAISLKSLSMSQWTFGPEVCEFWADLWFSLFLLYVYTFLLLSADRCFYITDKKHCEYRKRTRVRCICGIILAWITAILFGFASASFNASKVVDDHFCIINWHTAIGYFSIIIIATVVPCSLYTTFIFIKIFFWQLRWKCSGKKKSLSAFNTEYLLDPTHVVCLILFLVFWSSWTPFIKDNHLFLKEYKAPDVVPFWVGCSQGIWKFPIMIIFCPRYRKYFSNFWVSQTLNGIVTSSEIDTSTQTKSHSQLSILTKDSELPI